MATNVSFRMAEGSRTTPTRTVQTVSANIQPGIGLIRTNLALATPQIGDVVEIFTGGLSGNIGFYTLVNFSGGATGVGYYLRPSPNQQNTAGGSVARLNRNPTLLSGAGISGIYPLSGSSGNLALVYAPSANFRSNGVRKNDRAVVSGSSVSGNWGGWYVHAVLSDDSIVVRPPDRGAGMALESPASGVIGVRRGSHIANATLASNEVVSWETWAASGLLPVSGASLFQGSGELRDYVEVITGGQTEPRKYVQIIGLSSLNLVVSGTSGTTWPSRNESVQAPYGIEVTTISGAAATPLQISLGTTVSGDRYSVISGSAWCGVSVVITNSVTTSWYGSYWDPSDLRFYSVGSGVSGIASITRGSALQAQTGLFLESLIAYGEYGIVPTGAAQSKNVLVSSSYQTGNISTAGAVIEGLILGEAVQPPWAAMLFNDESNPAVILNPRVDLDIFTYFYIFFTGGAVEKRYTFNPRFRSADGGTPISGLTVEIYEVSDINGESLLYSETTDVDGRIGGGVGYDLRTQRLTSPTGYQNGTLESFTYRVTTQGGGYTLVSKDYEFTSRFDGDVTVEHIAPDYEGSYNE